MDFMEGIRDFRVVANPTKNTVHAFMNSLDLGQRYEAFYC